jgi:hypothetical protein
VAEKTEKRASDAGKGNRTAATKKKAPEKHTLADDALEAVSGGEVKDPWAKKDAKQLVFKKK